MAEAYRRAFSSVLGRAQAALTADEQNELRDLVGAHGAGQSDEEIWAWFGDLARGLRDSGTASRGARPKHVAKWLEAGSPLPPVPKPAPEDLRAHPAAEVFPMHTDTQLASLAADIKANGLFDPIVTTDINGETFVLDGRNRLAACKIAGVEPKFTVYTGCDPLAFVWSKNAERRHMTQSQLATTGEKFATLKNGSNRYQKVGVHACTPTESASREYAAKLVGVSVRSIQNARTLRNQGAPELVSMVEDGKLSLRAAVKVSSLPVEQQRELVREGPAAIVERANRRAPEPRLVVHNGATLKETVPGVFQRAAEDQPDQVAVAVRELRKVPLSRMAEVWERLPGEVQRALAWLAKGVAS